MNNSFNLKSLSLIAISTASLVLSTFQPAHAGEDGRVRAALTKAGMEFQVTNDHTFKVIVKLKDGRTHVVLIDSETSKINDTNMEFREIYALAHKFKGSLPVELSNKMMRQSHDKKIGSWEVIQDDTGAGAGLAVFTAKIDAALNDQNMVKIINSVGFVADNMEKEISDKDEY